MYIIALRSYKSFALSTTFILISSLTIIIIISATSGCSERSPGTSTCNEHSCLADDKEGHGDAEPDSEAQCHSDRGNPNNCFSSQNYGLAVGPHHICAIRHGKVYCWGLNETGADGVTSNTITLKPEVVPLPSDAVSVTVSGNLSCAVTDGGELACWNQANNIPNFYTGKKLRSASIRYRDPWTNEGILGLDVNGHLVTQEAWNWSEDEDKVISTLKGFGPFEMVSQNGRVFLASNGDVLFWGEAQIPNGYYVHSFSEIFELLHSDLWHNPQSNSDFGIVWIGFSYKFPNIPQDYMPSTICLVDSIYEKIMCYGDEVMKTFYQDDILDVMNIKFTDLLYFTVDDFGVPQTVMIAGSNICSILDSGRVICAGKNDFGQLGVGDNEERLDWQFVAGLKDIIALDGIGQTICAMSSSHDIYCWGVDSYSFLAGNYAFIESPEEVDSVKKFASIIANDERVFAVSTDADVYYWGADYYIQWREDMGEDVQVVASPVKLTGIKDVVNFSCTGGNNINNIDRCCAVNAGGSVWCWGLSYSVDQQSYKPHEVELAFGVKLVVRGPHYSCVISNDGSLWCWGSLSFKQKPDPTQPIISEPIQLPAPPDIIEIKGAYGLLCVLTSGNELFCSSLSGEYAGLGHNYPFEGFQKPIGLAKTTSFEVSEHEACAVSQGSLYCWGPRSIAPDPSTAVPQKISLPSTVSEVTDVAMGDGKHDCILTSSGEVYCWGDNEFLQLGIGSAMYPVLPEDAKPVPMTEPAISVTVGSNHTCAIGASKKTYCWGSNAKGQAGIGKKSYSTVPVKIPFPD